MVTILIISDSHRSSKVWVCLFVFLFVSEFLVHWTEYAAKKHISSSKIDRVRAIKRQRNSMKVWFWKSLTLLTISILSWKIKKKGLMNCLLSYKKRTKGHDIWLMDMLISVIFLNYCNVLLDFNPLCPLPRWTKR